jgi:hypothetical protein
LRRVRDYHTQGVRPGPAGNSTGGVKRPTIRRRQNRAVGYGSGGWFAALNQGGDFLIGKLQDVAVARSMG